MAIKCISHPHVSYTALAVINARDIILGTCKGGRSATNDFYNFLIENVEALK